MTQQHRPRLSEHEYRVISELRGVHTVGVISDTHEPFCLAGYREFCYDIFNMFRVDEIVHIGDEVDGHALSDYVSDPDGWSPGHEMEQAQKNLNEWYRLFPRVKVCIGNHTARPYRQAMKAGLPKRILKSYNEIWEAPDGWRWDFTWEIDGVLYEHGHGAGAGGAGKYNAPNRAKTNRQSTVCGHTHAWPGVLYFASHKDLIFSLDVGAGVDNDAYSMAYGKPYAQKPVIGCGIVMGGFNAFFVPMNLGKKYEWTTS